MIFDILKVGSKFFMAQSVHCSTFMSVQGSNSGKKFYYFCLLIEVFA